jgi:hypothetical protein
MTTRLASGLLAEGTLPVKSRYPITTQAQQNGNMAPLGMCTQDNRRPNGPAAISNQETDLRITFVRR